MLIPDPNTTNNVGLCVDIFSKLISAGATVFAACVAIYGINAWRREFKGKRDIELAEEVLELCYKASDAIRAIRSPLGYSHEGKKVIERMKSEGKEGDIDLRMATVLERYEAREETFQKLQMLRYRFMARFGKDKTKPFDDLRDCVNRVFLAAKALFYLQKMREEDFDDRMLDRRRQFNADLIWGDDEKDKITPEVETAVKEMEEICQKIIEGR
jgi:hypothetical protein